MIVKTVFIVKKRTVANRGKCEHCMVDSKNLQGKPSQYREKDK